jgi:mannose-6-phosphate isomerase-like protein (cupin superfamily)
MKYKRKDSYCCRYTVAPKKYHGLRIITIILALLSGSVNAQYLQRTLSAIPEIKMEFSTPSAHYYPVFGAGDDSSALIKGSARFGLLTLDPEGNSKEVRYEGEETVIFVKEGTGMFNSPGKKLPVSRNDFFYIPAGTRFGFSNPRESKLSVFIMGFKITPDNSVKPAKHVMTANTDEVPFQVLGSHGPTTQFQLLMGTTESTRDRLASACQVTSLFIMDFAAGGTNIPHRHDDEEEIYYILRGAGNIVAGETPDGKELRHVSREGDVWFFSPKTLIGFYSGNREGEEHARILAIRFKYPSK